MQGDGDEYFPRHCIFFYFLVNVPSLIVPLFFRKFSKDFGKNISVTHILCSIQQFDRSDRSGRVNGKRPRLAGLI